MPNELWLAGLLIIPGLFALALLMSWMETHLTQQMVSHDVSKAWLTSSSPDELEELVRLSAAKLRLDRSPPMHPPRAGGTA